MTAEERKGREEWKAERLEKWNRGMVEKQEANKTQRIIALLPKVWHIDVNNMISYQHYREMSQ